MKILYVGIFDPNYIRNNQLISGLQTNGVETVVISHRIGRFKKYYNLIKDILKNRPFDAIIAGFPAQAVVPIVRLITTKPIIADFFVSMYEGVVIQRKEVSKYHPLAWYRWIQDYLTIKLSTIALLDTQKHKDFIKNFFHVKDKELDYVYHGIESSRLATQSTPFEKNEKEFIITCHGNYQRLNGVQYIAQAIKRLDHLPIKVIVIGGGEYLPVFKEEVSRLNLTNVHFTGPMPREELMEIVSKSHLGLGFFTRNEKINRVIPNKLYELMSISVPFLTSYSSAITEVFIDNEDLYIVEAENAQAIADKIILIHQNEEGRKKLATKAFNKVKNNFTEKQAGKKLIDIINRLK